MLMSSVHLLCYVVETVKTPHSALFVVLGKIHSDLTSDFVLDTGDYQALVVSNCRTFK